MIHCFKIFLDNADVLSSKDSINISLEISIPSADRLVVVSVPSPQPLTISTLPGGVL